MKGTVQKTVEIDMFTICVTINTKFCHFSNVISLKSMNKIFFGLSTINISKKSKP